MISKVIMSGLILSGATFLFAALCLYQVFLLKPRAKSPNGMRRAGARRKSWMRISKIMAIVCGVIVIILLVLNGLQVVRIFWGNFKWVLLLFTLSMQGFAFAAWSRKNEIRAQKTEREQPYERKLDWSSRKSGDD